MENTETIRNLENIFFVKKGTTIERPNTIFVNSIKTISLDNFKFLIELDTPTLNSNKIIIVEYENIEDIGKVISNTDNPNISLYLENMAIVLDNETPIPDLPKTFKNIRIFRLDDLADHFNKLFDVYTEVLVLAEDISKKATKQIKKIISEAIDEEEPHIAIEEIAYLQEIRYYLDKLNHYNISICPDTTDLIVSYLTNAVIKKMNEKEIADLIVNESEEFSFYDSTWSDINEASKDVMAHLSNYYKKLLQNK